MNIVLTLFSNLNCNLIVKSQPKAKKAEKTFEDNMLRKLAKITDLMSRLDSFVTGTDCRVSKYLGLMTGRNAACNFIM